MKKLIFSILVSALVLSNLCSQVYKARDGVVSFNPNKAQTNKEYAAQSKEGTGIINIETGEVAFLVPMKSFRFNNALLEEHFNENYLHTNKYPNTTYKGKLLNFEKASFTKNGTYSVVSEGKVEMHGVSQNFHAPVEMIVKDGIVTFKCTFNVKADDYKIDIPDLVKPKLLENTPINTVISFQI